MPGPPPGVLLEEDPREAAESYPGQVVRAVSRVDALVALGFVLAAAAEAAARYHAAPGLLALESTGALWLAVLAVRREQPVLTMAVISLASVIGTALTAWLWPNDVDDAGVWILAMLLATYSLGAHAPRRFLPLGVLLPLVVVVSADATTRSGWDRISGMLFVTTFVGLLPTAVGRLVRLRHERLVVLREQQARILEEQQRQQQAAVLAERLRTVERLQPTLVRGLEGIVVSAETGADAASIETSARRLLTRTREEVVALTAPAADVPVPDVPPVDHVAALRRVAQPWTVLAAGAVVAGLSAEATGVLDPAAPGWLLLPASLLVGAPLAVAWWRPLEAVTVAWAMAAVFSRQIAPLDATLSGTAFALACAFGVALLSRRSVAAVGLVVCWLGQLVGVGTDDPVAEAVLLLLAWCGGLAVNEVSRLVEQSRANNEMLDRQEDLAAARAVVGERLRLSREIHDAIGHSLTVVALQAGAARRLASSDPARAREAIRTVADVARRGLDSLAADAPADITGLVERVRAAGLVVDADLAGEPLLDPSQRLIAFRVVQEGLTNVLRHAPGSRATVVVRETDTSVEIAVANTAPLGSGAGPGTGRGLAGIRERVAEAAGQTSWRPLADGGFEVRALLPLAPLGLVGQ